MCILQVSGVYIYVCIYVYIAFKNLFARVYCVIDYVSFDRPILTILPTKPNKKQTPNYLGTLPDGRFFVCGGRLSKRAAVLSTAECFDPRTHTWSLLPPMFAKRAGCAAAALPDGRVVVAGGSDGQTCLKTVEMFDFHTGVWSNLPSMRSKRSSLGLCTLDDPTSDCNTAAAAGPDSKANATTNVLVAVGGQSDISGNNCLASVEMLTIDIIPLSAATPTPHVLGGGSYHGVSLTSGSGGEEGAGGSGGSGSGKGSRTAARFLAAKSFTRSEDVDPDHANCNDDMTMMLAAPPLLSQPLPRTNDSYVHQTIGDDAKDVGHDGVQSQPAVSPPGNDDEHRNGWTPAAALPAAERASERTQQGTAPAAAAAKSSAHASYTASVGGDHDDHAVSANVVGGSRCGPGADRLGNRGAIANEFEIAAQVEALRSVQASLVALSTSKWSGKTSRIMEVLQNLASEDALFAAEQEKSYDGV